MGRPVNYKRIRNILLAFTIIMVVVLQAATFYSHFITKSGTSERARKQRAISEQEISHSLLPQFSGMPPGKILKNNYNGKFSLPNPSICGAKKDITLLILITTAVDHFELRDAVRSTWVSFAFRKDVTYAFVIGDALFAKHNATVLDRLRKEIILYNDFIIANFEDYYRNLIIKTLHMLDWTSTFCSQSKYLLKTDDDVFVIVPNLLEYIDTIKDDDEKTPKIYGDVFPFNPPQRNPIHKHFVSPNLYSEAVYPNFTTGPAYLMSTNLARPLFELALEFPYVPLEDVLVTGMVASNLNISRIHNKKFVNERGGNPIDLKKCDLIGIYAGMTNGSEFQMYTVWNKYLEGKSSCKIEK